MVLGELLPPLKAQSSLEWAPTSFEQFLAEFYKIVLGEYLQAAL
jgi:hypothetical protein